MFECIMLIQGQNLAFPLKQKIMLRKEKKNIFFFNIRFLLHTSFIFHILLMDNNG